MRTGAGYLRTDEYFDTAESFRAAAEFADDARCQVRAWKWLLIAGHSAVQGSLVLALSGGDFLQTLKRTNARDWLTAHEFGGPWPKQLQLDYFLELYRKAKVNVRGEHPLRVVCEPRHDEAMRRLNDLRNGFVHFLPQGWSIELRGLPRILSTCVEIANHLLWRSGVVGWPTDSLARRAQGSANHLARSLRRLMKSYEP